MSHGSTSARRKSILFLPLLILLLLNACTTAPKPILNHALKEDTTPLPGKLVVLPPDVTVSEVSAGGVIEKDQAWSDQAELALRQALAEYFAENPEVVIVPMPELDADRAQVVHDHILLYDVVASHSLLARRVPAYGWAEKIKIYDYTLGEGLKFLKEETGADAALFLVGVDYVTTNGRKAMTVFAALAGVALPVGSSTLVAGVVDLDSGKVLWIKYASTEGARDMRKSEDSLAMVRDVFSDYRK